MNKIKTDNPSHPWRQIMRRCTLATSLFLLFASAISAQSGGKDKKKAPEIPPRSGTSETIKLFNGKNLDGWEGYEDLWSVQDGVIVGKNTKPVKTSTYLVSKRKFTDFRLVFAAKLVTSEMHSGVALWGKVNPDVSKDPEGERSKYTYQGQLVMFPSDWGLFDLYRRMGAINPPQEVRAVEK